jgi:hypothetical protein
MYNRIPLRMRGLPGLRLLRIKTLSTRKNRSGKPYHCREETLGRMLLSKINLPSSKGWWAIRATQ